MGHEIVHHFDRTGGTFAADGSALPAGATWWSPQTAEQFDKVAKCFVQQYDNVTDPWTGKRLKGNATLRENLADYFGLMIAYGSEFERGEQSGSSKLADNVQQLLPGPLEAFTAEQLFFVTYAQAWCTRYKEVDTLAQQIDTDNHAPDRYRANLPLARFTPFSAAFNCPAEGPRSVMNAAKNRCI